MYESLPRLLEACSAILSAEPLFLALTMYAIRASGVHLQQSLEELMARFNGQTEAGELVTREKSAGRLLSQAVYARWTKSP